MASVTALSILGLVKSPPALVEEHRVQGTQLIGLGEGYREIRGRQISMIFQEPMSAFDPIPSATS